MKITINQPTNMDDMLKLFYWIFSLVYTFKVWGFWWSIVSIFLPIFPLIDGAIYLVERLGN